MTRLQRERYTVKCMNRVAVLLPMRMAIKPSFLYDKTSGAYCNIEPEYFRGSVNINIDTLTTEKEIAQHVLHEYMHIPGWELFTVAGDLARSTNEAKLMKKVVRRANETMASTLEDMFFLLVFPEFDE